MPEQNKKIQLDDIAQSLNLSKSTISRVISGKGRISEETRRRVLEYIKEHNYRPNVIARSLAQSKTFNIGVVLPSDSELAEIPFFQTCLMGVCETAATMDYDVVVTTVAGTDISFLKRLIENNKVDGIIITRSVIKDVSVKYLKENNVPFVVIGSAEDNEIVQIDTDHKSACCELTSYLLSQFMPDSVAFIAGNLSHIVNRNRFNGFRQAFAQKNLVPDESLIFTDVLNKPLIEKIASNLIEKRPDCVVCADDHICAVLLTVLNSRDISVPRDIRVASFYDSAFLRQNNPPVTAIDINVKALGVAAGKTLIDLINCREVKKKTLLDYEISIRKSTM